MFAIKFTSVSDVLEFYRTIGSLAVTLNNKNIEESSRDWLDLTNQMIGEVNAGGEVKLFNILDMYDDNNGHKQIDLLGDLDATGGIDFSNLRVVTYSGHGKHTSKLIDKQGYLSPDNSMQLASLSISYKDVYDLIKDLS